MKHFISLAAAAATLLLAASCSVKEDRSNRATFLKGSRYSTSGTGSFQVETAFETDCHMQF